MPGKYYEELTVGEIIQHPLERKITVEDNLLFNDLTMNPQPLHIDKEFAAKSQFGRRIVNGIYTLGLAVGITVGDLTEGTIVANLGYENVRHPAPVFHGDTIRVETEILSKRASKSDPQRGIVRLMHRAKKQDGTTVMEVERAVLFLKRPAEEE